MKQEGTGTEKRKKQDELLDHNYDGIQEYDNDLPRWWVQIFWITSIFGVVYAIWFHMLGTPSPVASLKADMAELHSMSAAATGVTGAPELTDEALLRVAADPAVVEKGKAIFVARCAACHMEKGQGLVGPNLTDEYWIHGGTLLAIRTVISEGVPEKGMLTWKKMMSADEITAVATFVWSLRGTKPEGPVKAPEGEHVP